MKGLKSQLLVIGCILAGLCSHVWALTLSPGSTQTGTIGSAGEINTYAFTASAGDVFDFTAVTTSGSLSPEIRLYNSAGVLIASAAPTNPYTGACSGAPTIELNTVQLPSSGSYSLWISDCSATNTGNYVLYSQRINNPIGAVNLTFGQTMAGTIGTASQSNTYTFSGNAGDQVDFTLTTTVGTLSPKIRLYVESTGVPVASAAPTNPYTGACSGAPTIELDTVTLPSKGTYTVLIGDCGDTNTGSYEIYSQRTDNPGSPVVPLLFGQTQTDAIGLAAQSNTYTFSANASDVVDFTAVTTSGDLSPKIRLYNPDGSLLSSAAPTNPYTGACSGAPTIEMNTMTLPSTGTYTLLVGDCNDTNTGKYAIYSQRINNPGAIVVPLPFGQSLAGMIGSAAQSNTYTFSANANDEVEFTLTTTSGSLSPKIRLYVESTGALVASATPTNPYTGACAGTPTVEMGTVKLPSAGTYIALIGDCGDTNTGNYEIYSQRTNNPSGAVPIDWGLTQNGTVASPSQSNTYVFAGSAGNVVDFTLVTTSGSLSPKIRLYNPDGLLLSSATPTNPYTGACSGAPTIEMSSVTLAQNGTYTVLVGDCSDTNTGNYNLSSQCFGTCPTTQVPKPMFSPEGGTYPGPLSVTVTDADTAATIYCTTNGSTPTISPADKYTGPIPVTASGTTIHCIAAVTGYTTSPVHSGTYLFRTATPMFTPATGTYHSVQNVTITDATPEAVFYYTTNGTPPTTSSTKYTGPIAVSASETVEAIAIAPGYADSAVATADYTIVGSPSALAAPATDVSTPDATLNAIVNTLGLTGSYIFEYGTSSTALTSSTPVTALSSSTAPVNVSAQLTGVAAKTTYYFQVVVTTKSGVSSGAVLSFTTN